MSAFIIFLISFIKCFPSKIVMQILCFHPESSLQTPNHQTPSFGEKMGDDNKVARLSLSLEIDLSLPQIVFRKD
tara:strand:- start:493 stop:714 length:222 start_codon:yes stop_codon:yes gene_type:complete